jgi:hydrogenase-4 component F
VLAILALGAMPPFGLFRSEFEIVAGGLRAGSYVAAAFLIIAVTVAFFGLAASATRMLLLPAARPAEPDRELVAAGARLAPRGPGSPAAAVTRLPAGVTRGEPSLWMVVPVAIGAVALLLLGLHPPAELTDLFGRAVAILSGRAS